MSTSRPAAKKVSLADIARRAGVSTNTVSRVVRGDPEVSEKTRTRIAKLVEELGYVPNYAARALAAKPDILILDDSASALDFATDAALRRALRAQTENMTVVMISQRASTIKNADRILVLDDGRQCGFGTHEALLESCGVYREICRSQGIVTEEVGV